MILKAIIDEQVYTLNVPDPVMARGNAFFEQLDRDMDQGWQMSREWVQEPNRLQRCQIVADKLLTALENENEKLGMLMAGYILARLPSVESVDLDVQGEIQNNTFRFREEAEPASEGTDLAATLATAADAGPAETPESSAGMGKMEAMAQAGQDVTQVFKVGRGYRFSVYDHASATWQDAPLIATETEAERLRQQAFKARYEALQKGA